MHVFLSTLQRTAGVLTDDSLDPMQIFESFRGQLNMTFSMEIVIIKIWSIWTNLEWCYFQRNRWKQFAVRGHLQTNLWPTVVACKEEVFSTDWIMARAACVVDFIYFFCFFFCFLNFLPPSESSPICPITFLVTF